ncbi:hypothetical protein RRG08_028031 [Elysia crispata]|uniref:Uncharacterized protein n=1 Tax=Elysia crispata TaxID=231223 RepID=A0AAE1BCS3_9GAST|nr:hypothetical protein RRG08_028031 [Elysia crispata]
MTLKTYCPGQSDIELSVCTDWGMRDDSHSLSLNVFIVMAEHCLHGNCLHFYLRLFSTVSGSLNPPLEVDISYILGKAQNSNGLPQRCLVGALVPIMKQWVEPLAISTLNDCGGVSEAAPLVE